MSRLRRQEGSTLILMLGVAATLAILALSLVFVLTSSMGFTKRDSDRTKSLHVAEAGIDAAQNLLAQKWPADALSMATADDWAAVYSQFDADYPASEFQRPKTPPFIDITVHDDLFDPDLLPADIVDDVIDYPRNNIMVVESQASVGKARTRIQVKVNRLEYDLQIRTGVALYAEGPVDLAGTGSAADSTPMFTDRDEWTATAYTQSTTPYPMGYDIDGQAKFPSPPQLLQAQDTAVTADSIFPLAIVERMRETAEMAEPSQKYAELKVESVVKALESEPNRIAWVTGDVFLTAPTTFFSEDEPGLLLVDGNVHLGGGIVFWGVIYAPNGDVDLSGGPEVHGMVMANSLTSATKLSGNRALSYNENVIKNLNTMVTLVVRLVPGTWREIGPE